MKYDLVPTLYDFYVLYWLECHFLPFDSTLPIISHHLFCLYINLHFSLCSQWHVWLRSRRTETLHSVLSLNNWSYGKINNRYVCIFRIICFLNLLYLSAVEPLLTCIWWHTLKIPIIIPTDDGGRASFQGNSEWRGSSGTWPLCQQRPKGPSVTWIDTVIMKGAWSAGALLQTLPLCSGGSCFLSSSFQY